jgi:hypothetical protein
MRSFLAVALAALLICVPVCAFAGTQSATVTIIVQPPPLAIALPTFANATVGQPYTAPAITASGGVPPYSWTATGLPPGMTINSTTGIISGTPTTAGNYNATVTVTDAASGTAQLKIRGWTKGQP